MTPVSDVDGTARRNRDADGLVLASSASRARRSGGLSSELLGCDEPEDLNKEDRGTDGSSFDTVNDV